mmetsp:Transcript_120113/g.339907  ORF Transcript_120113/g.339907 Transcript_120113/m.339907 type:complete len:242 (+) Transcript_120113:1317-2042(+)
MALELVRPLGYLPHAPRYRDRRVDVVREFRWRRGAPFWGKARFVVADIEDGPHSAACENNEDPHAGGAREHVEWLSHRSAMHLLGDNAFDHAVLRSGSCLQARRRPGLRCVVRGHVRHRRGQFGPKPPRSTMLETQALRRGVLRQRVVVYVHNLPLRVGRLQHKGGAVTYCPFQRRLRASLRHRVLFRHGDLLFRYLQHHHCDFCRVDNQRLEVQRRTEKVCADVRSALRHAEASCACGED